MISGMGSLSGTVTAPKEFKAAKVYVHNLDKNVVYMVYTTGGKYQAVDLFPGNYEVTVEKSGFNGGEPQKVTVTPGANATADLSMQEGVYRAGHKCAEESEERAAFAYDDLYPAGEGRHIHRKNLHSLPGRFFCKQWDADQWNAAIDLMLSTAHSNPPGRISEASVPGLILRMIAEVLVDYLVKNFGPDSTPRGLAVADPPVDEAALGKAMWMEYHIPPLPSGKERRFHDEHLSLNGDVWYADMSALQVGKMDPRTATWTDYPVNQVKFRGHGSAPMPAATFGWPVTKRLCASTARRARCTCIPITPTTNPSGLRTGIHPRSIRSRTFGPHSCGPTKLRSGIENRRGSALHNSHATFTYYRTVIDKNHNF